MREPYFKVGMDGRAFIRVDDPSSDLHIDSTSILPGTDSVAWQHVGKQFFAASMPAAAIECWNESLCFANATSAVATLLTNRAAALLRASRPAEVARDCGVALIVCPSQVKAAGRLVDALSELKFNEEARKLASAFTKQFPYIKSSLQAPLLKARSPSSGASNKPWWEKEPIASVLFIQSTSDEAGGQDWESIKAVGNDHFRGGCFEDAVEAYARALTCVVGTDVLGKLLCNRAAALMQLNRHHDALMNATSAFILNPGNIKALHRRVSALHKLDLFEEGLAACARAKEIEMTQDEHAAFISLTKTLNDAVMESKASPKVSTAEHKKLLDEHQAMTKKKDVMQAPQLNFINSMLGMLSEEQQVKAFGCKIPPMPPFHLELAKHRGWPVGVDVDWAKGYLLHAYEQSSMLPYIMETAMKSDAYEVPTEDVWKRANGNPERLKWLLQPGRRVGSVYPEDLLGSIQYPACLRQAFSNQAYRKELLTMSTVHVAVGFVDLGVLISCDINRDAPKGHHGPLRVVGVELSTFAVAKSLVVWQMVTQAAHSKYKTTAISVLQVWYSATWDSSTESAFRAAVRVMRGQSAFYGNDVEVSRILDHWASSKGVSLKAARSKWAADGSNGRSTVSHLVNRNDRLEITAYELTGDVFVGKSSQLCGSVCWWDCPDGVAANQTDQSFFSAFDMRLVIQERSAKQTVFCAAKAFLLRRVEKMIGWARTSSVVVEAIVGNVSDLVPRIAQLRPWTMSWSNVSDYYKPSEFHRIARACSIHGDTIHFAYSMNWSCDVSGSNSIDYMIGGQPDAVKGIFEAGNETMSMFYDGFKWKSTFRCLPPENPMNIADYSMMIYHHKVWMDYWFGIARRQGPCTIANIEPAGWNPLSSTGSNTIMFTFTYDHEISFNVNRHQGICDSDEGLVIEKMTSSEVKQAIQVMKEQWKNGRGGIETAAGMDYYRSIPRLLQTLQQRLAQLSVRASSGASSSSIEEQD